MLSEWYNLTDQQQQFDQLIEHQLMPALQKNLIAHSQQQIVWMYQTPSMDLLAPISASDSFNLNINVKRIQHFNGIIRRIFKYV